MDSPPILYEDNHVIAVNKPVGMLTQGDRSGAMSALDLMKAFIKKRDGKPGKAFLGLPHRLDRPTSGVMVFAKTSKALTRLAASFRDGEVTKIYWALVGNLPPQREGELTDWLRKDARSNTSKRTNSESPGAKEARLRYRVLDSSKSYHLLEVELLTGRHHQIRVQLAGMGCPVKGDLKYGARRSNSGGGIYLHAQHLTIPHPTRSGRISVHAQPPDDGLWNIFSNLSAETGGNFIPMDDS